MFHKIKSISALPEYRLSIQFAEGCTKIYDMKPLFERIPVFAELKDPHLFSDDTVDVGGHGIVWNDDLDLSCDELWENGVTLETPFDGLMAFSDATALWALNESTLQKAIAYGKLVDGVPLCNKKCPYDTKKSLSTGCRSYRKGFLYFYLRTPTKFHL